jgi:hypothetical protein
MGGSFYGDGYPPTEQTNNLQSKGMCLKPRWGSQEKKPAESKKNKKNRGA